MNCNSALGDASAVFAPPSRNVHHTLTTPTAPITLSVIGFRSARNRLAPAAREPLDDWVREDWLGSDIKNPCMDLRQKGGAYAVNP